MGCLNRCRSRHGCDDAEDCLYNTKLFFCNRRKYEMISCLVEAIFRKGPRNITGTERLPDDWLGNIHTYTCPAYPAGQNCSGFIDSCLNLVGEQGNYNLLDPRQSGLNYMTFNSLGSLNRGDLIFLKRQNNVMYSHVMIYLGEGMVGGMNHGLPQKLHGIYKFNNILVQDGYQYRWVGMNDMYNIEYVHDYM